METQRMRILIETMSELEELRDPEPKFSTGKSHVVKKKEERDKDQAIEKLQDVLNWLQTIETLDGYTKHNILSRAESIVKKVLG